jgi:uncharacterized membrane protein
VQEIMIDIPSMLMPVVVALVTIWVAKRFAKLTVTAKKWWLFAHVMGVAMYFAGILGSLLLAFMTTRVHGSSLAAAAPQFVHFFDWFLIIPGAILSLITGLVLAVRTNWGLTSYYWVILKWAGNIATIMFGATVMRRLISGLANAAASEADPLGSALVAHSRAGLLLGAAVSLATLLFLSAISYLKPWGKRTP